MAEIIITRVKASPGTFEQAYRDLSLALNNLSKYCWEAPRTSDGSPVGSMIPVGIREEVLDTTNSIWYKATGTTDQDWVALNS